jgi:hypothetical protein
LSNEEELVSHELFNKLNSKEYLEGEEDDGENERKYLEIIRKVRDENPELFEKIQKIPKKSSSARSYKSFLASVLTFFQKGSLKKFYISGSSNKEMSFLDSVKVFSCNPDCQREKLLENFFTLVERNKKAFINDFYGKEEAMFEKEKIKRSGNRAFAISIIQQILNADFIMEDFYKKKYAEGLQVFLEKGAENEQALKDFKAQCGDCNDLRVMLEVLQQLIPKRKSKGFLKNKKTGKMNQAKSFFRKP